jgi:uncharacterized protein
MNLTIKIFLFALLISVSSCGLTKKTIHKDKFINHKEIEKYPLSHGIVNDYEHLFTLEQKQELDSIIKDFTTKTKNQICIVSVEKYEPYLSLKDLTTDIGNYWGVGSGNKKNGLIISISKNKRTIWIGTGLGTEKVLTDEIVSSVISTKIIPYFKESNYYVGVKVGLLELINRWK